MSTSGSETKKMIVLVSSDGKSFEIEEEAAANSQMIKHMIEDGCADSPIPLPTVTSPTLAKVVEYCKHHTQPAFNSVDDADAKSAAAAAYHESVKIFDQGFTKDLSDDIPTLIDVLIAANYLNIKSLMDLGCDTTAEIMMGKTPQEIRDIFKIPNDLTPEELEKIQKENAWVFEE